MPAILRIDVDKPFLMWGSAPRPRKPSRGLKKSFTKRNIFFLSTGSFFRKKVLGCMRFQRIIMIFRGIKIKYRRDLMEGFMDLQSMALRWRKYLYRHTKNYHKR
ncbi:MAG TPA: hypothetical protein C5S37_10925 [Methanophagales archaeon]|nr:hypothetical protein [Methanophagales archaeon]